LQADSEETYLAWVAATQQAIGAAIQRGMSLSANTNPQTQSRDNKGPVRQLTRPKSRCVFMRIDVFSCITDSCQNL